MNWLAHTENDQGKVHKLSDHLVNTARRMQEFSFSEELKPLLAMAGLLHDLGKYQEEFQKYLEKRGPRGSVPHAKWGAMLTKSSLICNKWLSFPIYGHHSGLPNHENWNQNTDLGSPAENSEKLKKILANFFKDMPDIKKRLGSLRAQAATAMNKYTYPLHEDLMIRYVFSCLTDADWIDTDEHYYPEHSEHRISNTLDPDAMQEKLDAHLRAIERPGAINSLRTASRLEVLAKARDPLGFYSLHLPTGLGKTLTSLCWALAHAKEHGLKRIIIVLPYTSIIDQTGEILKSILGEDQVLEHHGGIIFEDPNEHQQKKRDYIKKFAVENWNYPVIVTTSVQFFETLFSNKTSKCRKLHNIAQSVVIFDEVQTLKKDIVLPTLKMLENVQELFGCSFLFCTATMPVFEKRDNFEGLENIMPLIQDPQALYDQVQRVTYHLFKNLEEIDLSQLKEHLISLGQSALVIFNLRETTKNCYIQMRKEGLWERVYHLSTFMCPKHRKAVIAQIRDDLRKQRKILVISTQLVEAGVDFDFPMVMRELGPLSSVIQAAGRCNREGKMGERAGNVYIFRLEKAVYPGDGYREEANFTKEFIEEDAQKIHDLGLFHEYYRNVIDLYVTSKTKITESRKELSFEDVANMYRVIDDGQTTSIFVRDYNAESQKLYNHIADIIKNGGKISKKDRQYLQQYSVQVYDNFFQSAHGHYESLDEQIYVWNGIYHKDIGITLENIDVEKNIL